MTELQPAQWSMFREQAAMLVKSGMIPSSIRTPEAAIAIMLKGRELGIPPMQAFAQISVINGKPAIGAELMLARIYERYPNAEIDIVRREADGCEIQARRNPKRKMTSFKFDLEDAKRAGVLGKDSWAKYPRAMFYWRAVTEMARALWPECLAGASHTPEELGAEVNEDGEVIDLPKPEKATTGVYRGTTEEQHAVQAWLKRANLPETFWEEFHERALNEPKERFPAILEAVRASAKAQIVVDAAPSTN